MKGAEQRLFQRRIWGTAVVECDASRFGGEHELQGSSPRNSFEQIASDKYDKGYIEMRWARNPASIMYTVEN